MTEELYTRELRDCLSPEREAKFFAGIHAAEEFLLGRGEVQRALDKLVARIEESGIPYAIIGAMALNEYGYYRVTNNIDVLLTRVNYETFARHADNDVPINVYFAGDYPGDGKPKPVRFPDPAVAAHRGERVRLLPLETAIELKIASGISAPHRLRDLADVLELIRICDLPPEFSERLDESVRAKFGELWQAAQYAR